MIDQHLHDIFNLAQTEDRRTLYLTQTVGRGVFDEDQLIFVLIIALKVCKEMLVLVIIPLGWVRQTANIFRFGIEWSRRCQCWVLFSMCKEMLGQVFHAKPTYISVNLKNSDKTRIFMHFPLLYNISRIFMQNPPLYSTFHINPTYFIILQANLAISYLHTAISLILAKTHHIVDIFN